MTGSGIAPNARNCYAILDLLSVVALLEDISSQGLRRGQVGTVVERLAPGVYEIEFSDDTGQTYANVPLRADQLLKLHHQPPKTLSPQLKIYAP